MTAPDSVPATNGVHRRARVTNGLPHPTMIDRLPPHSIEAEQGCLGCILIDPAVAMPELINQFGGNESFYDLRHQTIFDAMMELWDARIPLNIITLQDLLKRKNMLESVGGITYLSALPDATPSAHNAKVFGEMVVEYASLRKMIQACTAAVSRIYEGTDSTENLLSLAEQEVLAVRKSRVSLTPSIKTLTHEAIEEIERLHHSKGEISGLKTGFRDLDRVTDGLHGGEMIVLAGYPGGGKTMLAMNIAEHVAIDQGIPVGVFSLEMKGKRLVMRIIASRARVNMRRIRDGFLVDSDFPKIVGACGKLSVAPIHLCDQSDLNVSQMRAKARQMQAEFGIKMFVIDYIQLLSAVVKKDQSREQEVSSISRGIKQMAGELDAPVLALSQLNDDGKLRESRAIGQDADSIWVLSKKKEKDDDEGDAVDVTLKIRKQRDGEAPAVVHLTMFKSFTRFESQAKHDDIGL